MAVMVHMFVPHHIHEGRHPHIHILGASTLCDHSHIEKHHSSDVKGQLPFTEWSHHHHSHCNKLSIHHIFLISSRQVVKIAPPATLVPPSSLLITDFHSTRYHLMMQHLSYTVPHYLNRYTYHYIARSLGLRAPPISA